MRPRLLPLLVAALVALSLVPTASAKSRITLDGVEVEALWSDGDSFRVTSGPKKGLKSRIVQYNTLESYGPVHRWGTWTPQELARIAKQATAVVRAGSWTCEILERNGRPIKDHYGRSLIRCPDAAKALISQGLAHAMFVDEMEADRTLVEAQHAAQKAGAGMWAKGIPAAIVTSVHSADEPNSDKPYNRVVDTETGLSKKMFHTKTYERCTEACEGDACLLYVPFDERYGKHRADCLRYDAAAPKSEAAPTSETTPEPSSGSAPPGDEADPANRSLEQKEKPDVPAPGVAPTPTPAPAGGADEVL